MSQGKVYLVGTGPGDIGLITIKGYRLVCQADVILYDHLIPDELLKLAKPTAEIISVGKFAGKHTLPQNEINSLLVEKTKTNKLVVRLKGGDPYLFGRGAEEAQACVQAGIDFEEIPGVTSALAAPSYAGIPPTHRDYTSSVAIVTGHRKNEEEIEIPKAGTIIFLMSVANIRKIISSLLKAGYSGDTKIAAIERGTCYDQRVITGTLENFVEIIEANKLQAPAIFIVGQVVELQKHLDWFGKKPRILVLGTHPQKYSHLGNIVHRRMIDCVPLDDYSHLNATFKSPGTFDWIVFTSAHGIRFFFKQLQTNGLDTRALASVKIATIGKTSAETLTEFGIISDMVPDNESSEGLLEQFNKLDMKNKKVLLPQSDIASKELPDGLVKAGAIIEKMPIYKTIEIEPAPINFDCIDQILFTSGSIVRAFIKKFSSVPPHIKAYCLGLPTLNEAKKHNINAEVLPDKNPK